MLQNSDITHLFRVGNKLVIIREHFEETWLWLCCSGRIPRLSLIRHSLYVGVVEEPPPPPLTGEQYGNIEPKYTEGGDCQSVLRHQGFF